MWLQNFVFAFLFSTPINFVSADCDELFGHLANDSQPKMPPYIINELKNCITVKIRFYAQIP